MKHRIFIKFVLTLLLIGIVDNSQGAENKISIDEIRKVLSLNGDWKFMPDFEEDNRIPYSINLDDSDWYTIKVPSFWNEVGWWLFDGRSGASEKFRMLERERCLKNGFDYTRVNSGWYRKWFYIPEEYEGKHIVIKFMAVATVAEVWVNGKYIGGHIGMFTPFEFNLTPAIKYGEQNLISMMVSAGKYEGDTNNVIKTVVTMDVTDEMLNYLPKAMYTSVYDGIKKVTDRQGGIWQPVNLIITDKIRIEDVFIIPGLSSAKVQVEVSNNRNENSKVKIVNRFIDKSNGQVIFEDNIGENFDVESQTKIKNTFNFSSINPKLWSPEEPNLYILQTDIVVNGELVDRKNTTTGFRTFEVKGNKIYLNNKPYWARGANMPPHGLAPNDAKLAHKFLKLMRDGNQMFTRTTGSPFTEIWASAADEEGVGISIEGIWPWAMIGDSPLPPVEKINQWKQEHLELVKALRNHPSILLWTINNEMYFHSQNEYGDKNPVRKRAKWSILSSLIKEIRQIDPSRPIIADSGYRRNIDDYNKNLKTNNIDDGDIDDAHLYFGWYSPIPYSINKHYFKSIGISGERPTIIQECSTGYPNLDTGHPISKYIVKHFVPQAWVGDDAYPTKDSSVFLENHRFITKQVAELIRRQHDSINGVLLFANLCWFRNAYDFHNIEPYPVYNSVKFSLSPILVSMESTNRHFWNGTNLPTYVHIINDNLDGRELNNLVLEYSIVDKTGSVITTRSQKIQNVKHYTTARIRMIIEIPEKLSQPGANYILRFTLRENGNIVSQNEYPILIATRSYLQVSPQTMNIPIIVYDKEGSIKNALKYLGINYDQNFPKDPEILSSYHAVIIGKNSLDDNILKVKHKLRQYVKNGGKILSLEGGIRIKEFLPEVVETVVQDNIEFVNIKEPNLLLFQGIDSADLKWWNCRDGETVPAVANISFKLKDKENITKLGEYIKIHGYLNSPLDVNSLRSYPLFEYKDGKGEYIISELNTSKYNIDPLAAKFLSNTFDYLVCNYLSVESDYKERQEEEDVETFNEKFEISNILNCPNPFSLYTVFSYYLNQPADNIDIIIYSVSGKRLRKISNASCFFGQNEEKWDGRDEDGRKLANGIYFYKIIASKDKQKLTKTNKLAILR